MRFRCQRVDRASAKLRVVISDVVKTSVAIQGARGRKKERQAKTVLSQSEAGERDTRGEGSEERWVGRAAEHRARSRKPGGQAGSRVLT